MPSTKDVYGDGTVLKAADLPAGIQVPATISKVEVVKFDDGKQKLQLSFLNKEKVFTLNVTNCSRIEAQHGEDYEMWVGKMIHLMQDVTEYPKGTMTPCVRVVPHTLVAPQPVAAPPAQPEPAAQMPPADEIPF